MNKIEWSQLSKSEQDVLVAKYGITRSGDNEVSELELAKIPIPKVVEKIEEVKEIKKEKKLKKPKKPSDLKLGSLKKPKKLGGLKRVYKKRK